jgi:hypothetical protein
LLICESFSAKWSKRTTRESPSLLFSGFVQKF